jgi:hypothetical protein
VILGLGFLGGTNHTHYNVVFQWTEGKPVTDESDQEVDETSGSGTEEGTVIDEHTDTALTECPEELLAELDKIEQAIKAIRDILAD